MKRFILSLALMCVALVAFAGQEIPIASASRTATTTYSLDMYANKGDTSLTINNNVTSIPSAATLTITLQGKTPQGTYYDVLSSAATAASTSTFTVLTAGRGLPATTNVSANNPIPPVFRIKSVIAGSATYSIGLSRSN